jgi:hypothetical protein
MRRAAREFENPHLRFEFSAAKLQIRAKMLRAVALVR